jgi:hypothetical protein
MWDRDRPENPIVPGKDSEKSVVLQYEIVMAVLFWVRIKHLILKEDRRGRMVI